MYTALYLLLLALAAYLFYRGVKQRAIWRIVGGVIVALLTVAFFWFMDFWGEVLWFDSLHYTQRFWVEVSAQLAMAVAGAVLGWLVVYLLTISIQRNRKYARIGSRLLGALIGVIWGISNWEKFLQFWNRVPAGISEPVLNKDAAFYLFTLPFLDRLYTLLLLLVLVGFFAVLFTIYFQVRGEEIIFRVFGENRQIQAKLFRSLFIGGAIIVLLLAWGKYLSRYHLLFSDWGAVSGPGWTDVNIRLPAYYIVVVLMVLVGVLLLIAPLRKRMERFYERKNIRPDRTPLFVLGTAGAFIIVAWVVLLSAVPGLFQWLRVEPNEITFEEPFIANNIQYTRYGFNLHEVEEKEFPVSRRFTQQTVEKNRNLFTNVRLWDWRALDAVYKQFQEIRLYYEFVDVDIDRYTFGDSYRQVMISAREMDISNLPAQSQTFVNRRFKYTHGYGITLNQVSEFTPQGLPDLLVKDIPPRSQYPELKLDKPQIYYGELTNSHVYVNTGEAEFDYPSGEENVYINYPGIGGVQISNIWRKFLFGWKFDGTRFFFSGYPTSQSRIMFHRQIEERVKKLAPFLYFDDDPYIVLANGQLYWIIDAFTTSEYFPYSEPFSATETIEYKEGNRTRTLVKRMDQSLNGVNYIRNSVKVVVNAFDGSVDFYIFDPQDPVIRVWDRIYPNLFKTKEQMPEELATHVRYPADLLLVQGLVYAKYHMGDPTVFYNQEDLWIRATEKYYADVQPVEPYYVMWEFPGSDEMEFVLILPFTPKNRQVLIGWVAGMCDGENYGRFLAYKFPKEKRVLGPQQVETKIDQDRFLSGQLTLWDQRGSNVIRGNVLAIPVENTLIYVEPIYLQAETAAYPELRLVAVMHNDNLSYAESFDKALTGLFEETVPKIPAEKKTAEKGVSFEELVQKANTAFENYLEFLGQKNFRQAGQALETLQETLQQLTRQRPGH